MNLVEVNNQYAKQIKEWFSLDNPENRFIASYKDTDKWLDLIKKDHHKRYGYVAVLENEVVGFVDIELDKTNNIAYIAFAIAPNKRGQGLGDVLVKETIKLIKVKFKTNTIIAGVESENIASQQLLTKLGFRLINEEDDIKTYELIIAKS